MSEVDVYDMEGKIVKKIELKDSIFNFQPNLQLVSEVVNMYLANIKIHTASTKTKGEIRGGGKKPWRQKGTGRARAASIRSPLFRGGGVTFGPRPKKVVCHIPKKKRGIALKSTLSLKLQEGKIRVVEGINLEEGKSKNFNEILNKIQVDNDKGKKMMVIINSPSETVIKATSNLKKIRIKNPLILNALDVMSCDWLILELNSLPLLEKRV
ncbi:MAG: 50S ribosomal protein L4 [Candidatus Omnitrophica bacterium]|nr:50S ribosomal protein L4 [Candidatus Omnitrophota bacterium]MBU1048158.1 50S ribosomal protein L4 [Candidatus Omnitrophota bacterium]MBU1630308.1 50S ribosomal protein L4 [Candidatus Omnitrophota bacterium]MBU1767391.1 50S ribosomal protein L4 [Candidatus Omnitrophota bacterium]MBU1889253.1 50S ribosomal protein L4 [Candidatus Omnitrophota bacterium]